MFESMQMRLSQSIDLLTLVLDDEPYGDQSLSGVTRRIHKIYK